MTRSEIQEIKNLIIKTVVSLALLSFCIAMIETSKHIKRYEKLEKEHNELVIELEETKAIKEPTQYEIAEEVYDIDKYLLEAIETLETGHFTSPVFLHKNNAYGGRINGKYLSYDSHLQSTMELARLLRFSYYNKGLTDLKEIGKIYCPDDEQWADKVMNIYDSLK